LFGLTEQMLNQHQETVLLLKLHQLLLLQMTYHSK
jgi:hypothetical protein